MFHLVLARTVALATALAVSSLAHAKTQLAYEDAVIGEEGSLASLSTVSFDVDDDRLVFAHSWQFDVASGLQIHELDTAGNWALTATVPTTPFEFEASFGTETQLDGDTVAVAASFLDGTFEREGAVLVYERDSIGTWALVAELRSSAPGKNGAFGSTIALSSGYLVVSDTLVSSGAGQVEPLAIFERQANGTWPQVAGISEPGAASDAEFGHSIDLEGDRLVVSAVTVNGATAGDGRVHVYEREPIGTWSVAEVIDVPGSVESGGGYDVSLDGDRVLVGSASESTARLFARAPAGGWVLHHEFVSAPPQNSIRYGSSVHLAGSRVLVGSLGGLFTAAGTFELHAEDSAGNWARVAVFAQEPSPTHQGFFPLSLRLTDNYAIGRTSHALVGPSVSIYRLGTLYHGPLEVSAAAGGTQSLLVSAGPEHAGAYYVLVGSASGTAPGLGDPLGALGLPLVNDVYTDLLLSTNGAGIVAPLVGVLDGIGAATSALDVAPGTDPSLVGLLLHHAYLVIDPITFEVAHASNAVRVELVP